MMVRATRGSLRQWGSCCRRVCRRPRAQTSGNNGVLSLVVTAYCAVTSDSPKNVPPSVLPALAVCLQENNTMTSNWWELCCRFCSEMCGFSLGEYNKAAKPIRAMPFDCPAWNIGGIWKVLRRSNTRQRRPSTCTSKKKLEMFEQGRTFKVVFCG